MKRALVVLVASALAGGSLWPTTGLAEVDEVFKRLFAARSLKCKYPNNSYTRWDSGRAAIELGSDANMALHFDSIDKKAGSARIIGNQGAADVFVLPTVRGVHFLETTPSGNVNFTTVFAAYAKGTRDFVSVTSRHIDLNGPSPSQHHGTCRVWD